ncbi:unnamed protein product, partial [marine sediment metagenome]
YFSFAGAYYHTPLWRSLKAPDIPYLYNVWT